MKSAAFLQQVREFRRREGEKTLVGEVTVGGGTFPQFHNEFWTAKQRQAASIHEISYRACFKPQLPRFFIEGLTEPGDLVYDPFAGRGTTPVEAALLGRRIIANDINPLSAILTRPRFFIPDLASVKERLGKIPLARGGADIDLSMFYHPRTKEEIVALRQYLLERREQGTEDYIDQWIRLVATNRLSGHSHGFFSVYTLPPNQAVSPKRQALLNEKRKQRPEYRDIVSRILRKSRSLVRNMTPSQGQRLAQAGASGRFLCQDARWTKEIKGESVDLTVTSPPFLDVVQYAQDNWLRCWFNGIDAEAVGAEMTTAHSLAEWQGVMGAVLVELYRITRPGGWAAFEVGEVRKGKVCLDEHVLPLGLEAGFACVGIIVNRQEFTKTANIWGVSNKICGTNTNRIVLFRKE